MSRRAQGLCVRAIRTTGWYASKGIIVHLRGRGKWMELQGKEDMTAALLHTFDQPDPAGTGRTPIRGYLTKNSTSSIAASPRSPEQAYHLLTNLA